MNSRDLSGLAPLTWAAAFNSDIDVVALLTEHGANFDAEIEKEQLKRLLHAREFVVREEALSSLFGESGEADRTMNALFAASSLNPNPMMVRWLLQKDPSARGRRDALCVAVVFNGKSSVAEELLKAGADPNARRAGFTPLMLAAGFADGPESAALLLRNGAAPDNVDALNRTALMLANELNDNEDIVAMLLNAEANISRKGGKTERNSLTLASESHQSPILAPSQAQSVE